MPSSARPLAFALVAGFAVTLAACAAPAAPSPTTSPSAAATGAAAPATGAPSPVVRSEPSGRVTLGLTLAGPRLQFYNPGEAASGLSAQYFWPVFDSLVLIDRDGKVQPSLAREWRTDDARTWTFTLRDDIRFHDGTPLTSADVVGTFEYYRDPKSGVRTTALFGDVDAISAPSPTSVVITLKKPVANLPRVLSLAMVTQGQKVREQGDAYFERGAQGTGPYRFVKLERNTSLELEAMPASFVTPRGTANVKTLVERFIPEPATLNAALQTGAVDIASPVTADSAAAFQGGAFRIVKDSGTQIADFGLDNYDGPTTSLQVRQAINYAVDRKTILAAVFGGYGELDAQLVVPEMLGYNPQVQPYGFDQARARQLLAQAGFPTGFRIPMTVYGTSSSCCGAPLAEAVSADLRKVGIETDISLLESAVWSQNFNATPDKRRGLFAESFNFEKTFEPDSIWPFWTSDRTLQTGRRWNDQRFDDLYQRARTTVDERQRAQLYQQAAQYFHEQAPVLFLWRFGSAVALRSNIDWNPGLFQDAMVSQLKFRQ